MLQNRWDLGLVSAERAATGRVGLDGGDCGSRWGDLELGDRSEATFLRLLARLPETGQYRSDPYGMYEGLPRNRHVSGKGGAVNWNEGLPSRGRDPLKRLQRQTKGYTKSLTMRRDSLALV